MTRENMKHISGFFAAALVLYGTGGFCAPVPQTAGNNLTAYNPSGGAINNNNWNNLMNNRSGGGTAPTADFGNCNSLILRCAQPKCANGGCTSMDVARPIVSGCVLSNSACKQYGNDLIESLSAQLVANSTARANQQAAAAQSAAVQAASAATEQQMQQMQSQMQQMQSQMAAQNAQAAAQLQAALDKQQELAAQAAAAAAAASATTAQATAQADNSNVSATQIAAAQSGVSANVLVREQISGQILTQIENAEVALKSLKAAMNDTFEYADCDAFGNNCTGPKRVKVFKDRAMKFFDPYNTVLDELYDALVTAQSVGVDITDIYMMLNGTCNAWAQYLCSAGQELHYTELTCINGRSTRSGQSCQPGQVKPMSDGGCQLIKMLTSDDEVQRNWLYPEPGENGASVQVGCASEALDNSALFRNRKKQSNIDIETLQRIIEQDAPAVFGNNSLGGNTTPERDGVKYCALNSTTYQDLQKAVSLKQLPAKVCVTDTEMINISNSGPTMEIASGESSASIREQCAAAKGTAYLKCLCDNTGDNYAEWDAKAENCKCVNGQTFDYDLVRCGSADELAESKKQMNMQSTNVSSSYNPAPTCAGTGGVIDFSKNFVGDYCICSGKNYNPVMQECENGLWLADKLKL